MIFSKDKMIDEMIVYATRYSINRRSYASGSMADMVIYATLKSMISIKTMSVLARDIQKALTENTIPYEDQRTTWKEALRQILKRVES